MHTEVRSAVRLYNTGSKHSTIDHLYSITGLGVVLPCLWFAVSRMGVGVSSSVLFSFSDFSAERSFSAELSLAFKLSPCLKIQYLNYLVRYTHIAMDMRDRGYARGVMDMGGGRVVGTLRGMKW